MFFDRSRAIRQAESDECEQRLQQITSKLEAVTGTVQERVVSLGEVAERLEKLKEALDNGGIKV